VVVAFDDDELAEAVPERVSDVGDRDPAAEGRSGAGAGPPRSLVAGLGLSVLLIGALVAFLLVRGGPPPSPDELARQPLNPKPSAPPSGLAATGQPVYEASCARCHGLGGDGGAVAGAPSLRARRVALAPDSAILSVVRNGFGAMPPVPLATGDEAALVAYLRYLEDFSP
jgi:mono/diheme cytochrome c family protein